MSKDARFDGLKDINKIVREQVGPLSYDVPDFKAMHRPNDKTHYNGKFKRDSSVRLDSCTLYKPSRDVTPAPTDTDNAVHLYQKNFVLNKMSHMSVEEREDGTHFKSWLSNVRQKNLPQLRSQQSILRSKHLSSAERTS